MKFRRKDLFRISLILLLFLPAISGCSFGREDYTVDDNWEDEVLVVSECGFDGLQCCADQEPSCKFGQTCCSDPNDPKNNYCADECSCGKRGAFCCAEGDSCDGGLSCREGKCIPCGDADQACCGEASPSGTAEASPSGTAEAGTCNNDLICYYDKCVECGLPGAPCCANTSPCQASDSLDGSRLECKNNLCAYCGANGRIACPNDPICQPEHLLNNFACLSCGNDNQPCCATTTDSDLICKTENGLECNLGFCSKKK